METEFLWDSLVYVEADFFIFKEAFSRQSQWVFLDNGLDLGLFIDWDRLIWVFLRFYWDASFLYVCCDACSVS